MTKLSVRALALSVSMLLSACASRASAPKSTRAAAAVNPCGDARTVALDDPLHTGGTFTKLSGTHYAELVFTCPSDEPCGLPEDRQIELTVDLQRDLSCELPACKVAYLGNFPFKESASDPCPNVLWSTVNVQLKTDAGLLDAHEADVNVLASPHGEAFLRFMLDNPSSLIGAHASATPRAVLIDVQLELEPTGLRGRLSALAAALPSEPASDLRFSPLWTATWQTTVDD